MQAQSLGLIETFGYTAAVEAVDAACKAADVTFLGYDRVGKGLVTVKFTGDIAAVKAAVTAGAAAAERVGRVISVHVIPRPHYQLGAFESGPPPGPVKAIELRVPGGLPVAVEEPAARAVEGQRESHPTAEPPAEEKKAPEKGRLRPSRARKSRAHDVSRTKRSEIGRRKKPRE